MEELYYMSALFFGLHFRSHFHSRFSLIRNLQAAPKFKKSFRFVRMFVVVPSNLRQDVC